MPRFDTHVHAFADGLPLAPGRRYTPARPAPLADLVAVLDNAGVDRALLVQPSFLADDHAYLLRCLAAGRDRFRGVVAVRTPEPALAGQREWHAAGVRGVRLNLLGHRLPDLGGPTWAQLGSRMAAAGWHLEIHAAGDQWRLLHGALATWPGAVVLDHLGRAEEDDARSHVLALARLGHVWVKLSAPYRTPDGGAADTARAVLDATGGTRVVWGSDWPFTTHEREVTYRQMLEWPRDVLGLAPDDLDGNAGRLLGWV